MNQATKIRETNYTPEQYSAILAQIRRQFAIKRPDVYVKGCQLVGGNWHAITDAGPIAVKDA